MKEATRQIGSVAIYTVYHKPLPLPESDALHPIDAGREDGEHLAYEENYSELRAHYWVWKNEPLADMIGFFHFRRYLDLSAKPGKIPYRIVREPDVSQYRSAVLLPLVQDAGIIAPRPEYTGLTVWQRYAIYPGQDVRDLQTVYRILSETQPSYRSAADDYLNGREEYYGNLFLMQREIFCAYCAWLFPILERFRKESPEAGPRTEGYLAERLFGIYLTWAKQNGIPVRTVPRLHFTCYDDAGHHTAARRYLNFLLPPGSRLRGFFNRLRWRKKADFILKTNGMIHPCTFESGKENKT